MKKCIILWLIFLLLAGCSKNKDILIGDNVPPPDYTIDSSVLVSYTNRVYVIVTGREPVGNERADAMSLLRQDNFSVDSRKAFLDDVFSKEPYKRNLYNIARVEYLQNLDSTEIEQQIILFNLLLQQPQYAPFYTLLQTEVSRLNSLKSIVPDMYSGTADYREMLKRVVNNYFYDQINMGTENFVISTFQSFLFRYPTDAELAQGKTMVDGNNAMLFLQLGKSREDYADIFFSSDDFYEGQVRYLFKKYLFRDPSQGEIVQHAALYKNTDDYRQLQKAVLSSDEFAGVN